MKVLHSHAFTRKVSTHEIEGPNNILKEIHVFSWGMWLSRLPYKFFAARNSGVLTACSDWYRGHLIPVMKRLNNTGSDAKYKEEKEITQAFFFFHHFFCGWF